MALIEVFVSRLRVRVCRCGFWCDDNFLPDDELPDRWEDHLLEHGTAASVFRWRGDFRTTVRGKVGVQQYVAEAGPLEADHGPDCAAQSGIPGMALDP